MAAESAGCVGFLDAVRWGAGENYEGRMSDVDLTEVRTSGFAIRVGLQETLFERGVVGVLFGWGDPEHGAEDKLRAGPGNAKWFNGKILSRPEDCYLPDLAGSMQKKLTTDYLERLRRNRMASDQGTVNAEGAESAK